MKLIQIIKDSPEYQKYFKTIVDWYFNWWGKYNNMPYEEVSEIVSFSFNSGFKLPQTFAAIKDDELLGVFTLSMNDDLVSRVDVYPWLANVYVAAEHRNNGVCRFMMQYVEEKAKAAGLKELYLYTRHIGLYEKFNWKFVCNVNTYRDESPIERLYNLRF